MPSRAVEAPQRTVVRGHDGLRLAATLTVPVHAAARAVLMLHDAGTNRDQGGFYPRLADEFAEHGIGSLRLDLPGHGDSEGSQADLSLSGLLTVISAGLAHLREHVAAPATLLATGLTAGVAAGHAARRGAEIDRLVLLNPVLDYRDLLVGAQPAWIGDFLAAEPGRTLLAEGRIPLSPGFAMGRAMLDEVVKLQRREILALIATPTLVVHGAGPTDVPVASSRAAAEMLTCAHRLVEIDGPQSAHWQAPAIRTAIEWISGGR